MTMLSFRSQEAARSAVALELGCCPDEAVAAPPSSTTNFRDEDDTMLLMALEGGLFGCKPTTNRQQVPMSPTSTATSIIGTFTKGSFGASKSTDTGGEEENNDSGPQNSK